MALHRALEIDFVSSIHSSNFHTTAKYRLKYITISVRQFRTCLEEIMSLDVISIESCYLQLSKTESDRKPVVQSNKCTI